MQDFVLKLWTKMFLFAKKISACYMVASQVDALHSELYPAIELFCERALSHTNADLELCTGLLFSLPAADIKKVTFSR